MSSRWRGMAALLIEERELHRFILDNEVGDYYQSFDRFLKCEYPGKLELHPGCAAGGEGTERHTIH